MNKKRGLFFIYIISVTIKLHTQEIAQKNIFSLPAEMIAHVLASIVRNKPSKDFICQECGLTDLRELKPLFMSCKRFYNNESLLLYLYKDLYPERTDDDYCFQIIFFTSLHTNGCKTVLHNKLNQADFLEYTVKYTQQILNAKNDYFYFKTLHFLHKSGFVIDRYADQDGNPLFFSFLKRLQFDVHDTRLLPLVLKSGVNPDNLDVQGKTPLMIICSHCNSSGERKQRALIYLRDLLYAGAKPDRRDKLGLTALDYVHGVDNKFLVSSILDKYLKKNLCKYI